MPISKVAKWKKNTLRETNLHLTTSIAVQFAGNDFDTAPQFCCRSSLCCQFLVSYCQVSVKTMSILQANINSKHTLRLFTKKKKNKKKNLCLQTGPKCMKPLFHETLLHYNAWFYFYKVQSFIPDLRNVVESWWQVLCGYEWQNSTWLIVNPANINFICQNKLGKDQYMLIKVTWSNEWVKFYSQHWNTWW